MWRIKYTKLALKDKQRLERAGLAPKAKALIDILVQNPFQNPPPYEKLQGEQNAYSRRLSRQHRLTYQVHQTEKTIKIARMWSHYE